MTTSEGDFFFNLLFTTVGNHRHSGRTFVWREVQSRLLSHFVNELRPGVSERLSERFVHCEYFTADIQATLWK